MNVESRNNYIQELLAEHATSASGGSTTLYIKAYNLIINLLLIKICSIFKSDYNI
jgi:hypothetical protein